MTDVTVRQVCEFWDQHYKGYTKAADKPRVRKLIETLGDVRMCDLRRQQLWDCFGGKSWSYRRDSLQVAKRVFGFAIVPRLHWATLYKNEPPKPILMKWDNPLDSVVVNHKDPKHSTKAYKCPPEFEQQMTVESEAAYRSTQRGKAVTISHSDVNVADDAIDDLAIKALNGDPITRDMLRDFLKL